MDEERLRAERANRGSWKSRVTGLEDVPGGTTGYPEGPGGQGPSRRPNRQRPGGTDDDDLEYRLAIEASKNQAEEDAARRSGGPPPDTDDDLAKAIKLSKEEEELRKRELEDQQQGDLLFDNTPTAEQAPQPTGFNQGYQQQAAVDWFGNPLGQQQQQQPQQTGFMNNVYSQPTGFQGQNGYGGGFGYNQPQQTGFDQMQQPQQQFIQPQNTYNPWGQQMNGFGQQQQQQQPQQQPMQEQPTATPGSNNPWAGSNSSTPVQAQPTGSNNPFATQRPQQTQSPFSKGPTLSTLAEQRATDSFPQQQQQQRPNPISNYSAPAPSMPVQQQPTAQQKPQDPYQAKLSALLSSGEGQDTFGNTGDMRIPAQHTAPGTFVNSAGAGSMGALEASRTGNNPFFTQNTAAQMQYPAQTGPVGSMGGGFGGGNNPFGPRPGQQQQQNQGQGGSLIDL